MAKTNEPSIDRPPRGGPATRQFGWKIQRLPTETRIIVPGATSMIVVNRVLTDEQLDLLRLAALDSRPVTAETVVELLADADLQALLLDHYRAYAYDDWKRAVGLLPPLEPTA